MQRHYRVIFLDDHAWPLMPKAIQKFLPRPNQNLLLLLPTIILLKLAHKKSRKKEKNDNNKSGVSRQNIRLELNTMSMYSVITFSQ